MDYDAIDTTTALRILKICSEEYFSISEAIPCLPNNDNNENSKNELSKNIEIR